ncbi:MAG: EVE domain-containing protein [Planctomycetota bacterium]|nr:EVE domain-containing protein [Planctomycetota bacterium]
MAATKYWLMKTEPSSYSIQDLAAEKKQTTFWDGVRNYQARNYMRDEMKLSDKVLFYHSNADPPAITGVATIVRESYPDHTSWDVDNKHYDPKSTAQSPRWFMVDIKLEQIFAEPIGLDQLRGVAALRDMELLRKGSRLSVQVVRKPEFDAILKLAKKQR